MAGRLVHGFERFYALYLRSPKVSKVSKLSPAAGSQCVD